MTITRQGALRRTKSTVRPKNASWRLTASRRFSGDPITINVAPWSMTASTIARPGLRVRTTTPRNSMP